MSLNLLQIQIYFKMAKACQNPKKLSVSVPKYCVSRTGKIMLNQNIPCDGS